MEISGILHPLLQEPYQSDSLRFCLRLSPVPYCCGPFSLWRCDVRSSRGTAVTVILYYTCMYAGADLGFIKGGGGLT